MTRSRGILPPRRFWTPDEDAMLLERYANEATWRIARDLERPVPSVYRRANKLGLSKSEAYLYSPDGCALKRQYTDQPRPGQAHWYPKGHVPANRGQRRPGYGPGRMKETQFKKGSCPVGWMPVGATRLSPDGYVLRKVSDIRKVHQHINWKLEHRLVWEAAHGPVPRGHCLRFKDGNRQNCALDNLELVTRRSQMARHSVHNLPAPLPQTIQLLGALTRQIRRRTRHGEKQDR